MDNKEIGERIKEIRKKNNLTQKKLAEKTSIDVTSISRYETGNQMPNLDTLVLISMALEVSLDYIVFGTSKDFTFNKKETTSREETIFKSLAILLENNVIDYYNEYDGTYLQLHNKYISYEEFIEQYNKLKDFKGIIGKGFEDAKKELIKSYALKLKNEIEQEKYTDNLPF